ncbi:hypothetical protein M0R45_037790 [Rubus argutus]|uniref:Uncharacterized protein n=1 Tax=Rubus argutus TaxID=59490 RepID=A0AAW1W355_RUBAR
MAFRQLMNKFSKLMKKKPQPKTLADFVDKPRKLWSEENAESLGENWTEEQVQELMKYKLKVEYDPKMPLDRYELLYNPQDQELLKKLGEKKEEKEGNGTAEEKKENDKEGNGKAEEKEGNGKAEEKEGNGTAEEKEENDKEGNGKGGREGGKWQGGREGGKWQGGREGGK